MLEVTQPKIKTKKEKTNFQHLNNNRISPHEVVISNGNKTEEYNSESNLASDLKSAERVARGRFRITARLPMTCSTYYQLIVSITK